MMNRKVVAALVLAGAALLVFASLALAQTPTASITSPADGATVSGKVTVQGSATGPAFSSYKVEFKSSADWVLTDGIIHNTPVVSGTLVTWDTTTIRDGAYALRLLVADTAGQYVTSQISVTVGNAAAAAAAAAPRRGCTACHTQIAPDGRYTLAWEAQNAAQAAGLTHPALANGYKTTYDECMTCHASQATGDAGKSAPLSMRAIVHPVHMFSETFLTEFTGNCFSCHDVDGSDKFTVISEKMSVNSHGVPQTK
ncbi:MAG: Ig-like domain-containing protein [Chloroflexi bacterium]|nr:Ig-like domain-containing protein [Chloroflexota bacterium]